MTVESDAARVMIDERVRGRFEGNERVIRERVVLERVSALVSRV